MCSNIIKTNFNAKIKNMASIIVYMNLFFYFLFFYIFLNKVIDKK